ncbi:MAG TPA: biotin--[acetyl-CoA-carboxylase] ligase [Burkholderiaceae bacterium]|nr:biotin--[acetyl-CoA-carboxylase] ligase [Burkholderiaceae bacterium]
MLDSDALRRAVAIACGESPHWRRFDAVRVVECIDSTNSALMALAVSPSRPPRVFLGALTQTAGRGRLGRHWLDSAGASLTASLGLELPISPAELAGFTLACGLAVRAAIATAGVDVALKWPNDVVAPASGAKLGGLLVEAQPVALGTWVVVGIGLNLQPSDASARFDATDLASLGGGYVDPNALAARVIAEIERTTDRFIREGFRPFRAAFDAAHLYHGRDVELRQDGQCVASGRFEGVGPGGEVLLREAGGARRTHVVGDLSLRAITERNT